MGPGRAAVAVAAVVVVAVTTGGEDDDIAIDELGQFMLLRDRTWVAPVAWLALKLLWLRAWWCGGGCPTTTATADAVVGDGDSVAPEESDEGGMSTGLPASTPTLTLLEGGELYPDVGGE
jgi:hypothetical protein